MNLKDVWLGRAFNLDEAYEVLDGLNIMAASRSERDRATSAHASTLNTLIGQGKKEGHKDQYTFWGNAGQACVFLDIGKCSS